MRLQTRDEPLLDETMELPSLSLSVAPGPPHPRGGRGSFASSYSSGFTGTDSLCSFNSSQLFDDSDSQEVDVDDLSSSSSRGDYALLSMPIESTKRMIPTTSVITRPSSRLEASWGSQITSFRSTTGIADALRELREGRVAVEEVLEEESAPIHESESKLPSVTLKKLVTRLSSQSDLFVLSMGLLAATIHGALWSMLARLVETAITAFAPYNQDNVDAAAVALMLLSLALGITAYAAHLCLSHTAEKLLRSLREQVLRHLLLDLNQLWFDTHKKTVSSLGEELTREAETIRQGLGLEIGAVCRFTTQFIGGFFVAFMSHWDLTLALTCVSPIIIGLLTALRHIGVEAEDDADLVAIEALNNMQTLLALNAIRRVREKHALRVRITERERVVLHGKKAALQGSLTGTLWIISAIGLWYGGKKVYEAEAKPSQVIETLLSVLIGSHALGHLLPSFTAVFRAKQAASKLFALLETPSSRKNSLNGVMNPLPRPETCSGAVMVVGLYFSCPTYPLRQVLKGCNVSVMTGESVAVVGDIGAGKSTLITLLMRLYESSQGLILLDGRELNSLDPTWVRAQLGVVTQHVTLFKASIFDNIAMGLIVLRDLNGRETGQMQERVINAAQRADVHDLIMSLPDGYNTQIGAFKLTKQQQQRIALARALIRDPKLLLLDEMALSPQELLSRFNGAVGAGSTTMLFCTRYVSSAAVQYADKVVVLDAGQTVEQGTHEELLQRENSVYRRLYRIQHTHPSQQELSLRGPVHSRHYQQRMAHAAPTSPTKLTKRDIQALARPERKFLMIGLVASIVVGLAAPLLGMLISEMLADMMQQYARFLDVPDAKELVKTLHHLVMRHGLFLSAGAAAVVVFQAIQLFCLDAAAERVASQLRDLHFTSLLAQRLSFFDVPQHSPAVLVNSLATQAATASLVVGRVQGYKLQISITLMATLALTFWKGSWMLTLVLLAALPLLLMAESIRAQYFFNTPSSSNGTALEEAVNVHVSEALRNRQSVVMLGLETSWCSSFDALLQRPLQHTRQQAQLEAVAKGLAAVVTVATCALTCWLSGVLVHSNDASFRELIRSLVVVLVSAQSLGLAVAWVSRVEGALQAGAAIFALRDAAVVANGVNGSPPSYTDNSMPQSPAIRGCVTIQDVHFTYSTRPNTPVLNGLKLHIAAGQTVALCGPRDAGISTIFALLEGFYDLSSVSGSMLLDGVDIRTLDVAWLRTQISLVGSDPTLFLGTISENISYGMVVPPTMEMIVAAAEVAHAHAFISRLPEGYATRVGDLLQLSPSQRQRIALARAVLQDARLLLLDEPTRSLGVESEKMVVQQALDTIVAQRVRRTTVIAAHPGESATVRNADMIYIVENGQVVDHGTHSELLQFHDGIYTRLVRECASSSSSYTINTSAL